MVILSVGRGVSVVPVEGSEADATTVEHLVAVSCRTEDVAVTVVPVIRPTINRSLCNAHS